MTNLQQTTQEAWKDIPGYEGLYQISTIGRVKSLPKTWIGSYGSIRCHNGRILKPGNHQGYWRVLLKKNNKERSFLTHRLVAMAFILNPENKPEVNHINGNRGDSRIENLEWVTKSENQQHAVSTGLHNCKKSVYQYSLSGIFIKEWDSIINAARAMGRVSRRRNITSCIRGNVKAAYGFIWKDFKADKIQAKIDGRSKKKTA